MELKEVQRHWDAFGKTDPLWAILTQPDKRHGKWKYDEFFSCGEEEISRILQHAATLAFPLHWGRALDFGCGAGRLTQALARHFQVCDGVDIAPSMIALAQKYDCPWPRLRYEVGRLCRRGVPGQRRWANSWPGLARLLRRRRCQFTVNPANDLTLFPNDTFDLIYSSLVLQHMRPEYSLNYIKEFLRVLTPGGLMVFQIPSRLIPERELPYRAHLRAEPAALTARPGESMTLRVWVKNVSDFTWPAVNLGNHWLNANGEQIVLDDARLPLPLAMKPGQEVQVSFPVTALRRPGNYALELDVVQESVLWFQTMGSPTIRIPCQVQGLGLVLSELSPGFKSHLRRLPGYHRAAQLYHRGLQAMRRLAAARARPASPARPSSEFEPVMETYGVPRDELVQWIERHGGRIVDIQNDLSVGKDWESFRYYVTKPPALSTPLAA